MKIEDGKTSSDIFAGCAPLQWIREVAVDFAEAVWGKIVDVGNAVKSFFSESLNVFRDAIQLGSNAVNRLLNQPVLQRITPFVSAAASISSPAFGAIMLGVQVYRQGGACIKALFRGAAVVGAVAGGLLGLKALAGSGAALLLRVPILGALIRFVTRTVAYAYSWNWQITDREIQQRQNSVLVGLAGQAGSAVGTTLGGLLCGGVAGASILKFNPRIAAKMWEVAGDDIKDEIVSSIQALAQGAGRAAQQLAFLEVYKSGRAAIKRAAQNPAIKALLPDSWERLIATWGDEGNKPWSFALAVEEKIESIKDEKLKAFTENAIEEFMDMCTESMMAVSYAV